jgi:glycine cleavage system transcriptional repressor
VTQSILQTEFAGIFIASIPASLPPESLLKELRDRLSSFDLTVLLKRMDPGHPPPRSHPSEPFVVTTSGPDRLGLVAGITQVMARFGVNITNLKAVFRGGDDPQRNVMIYEVDVPDEMDPTAFRQALRERADELGIDLSMQHRNIFETIHRV